MSGYTWLWIVWLVQFGAIEGAALIDKHPGDTLSEHVWDVFTIRDKPTGWIWRRGSLLLFLGWLVAHLMRWV